MVNVKKVFKIAIVCFCFSTKPLFAQDKTNVNIPYSNATLITASYNGNIEIVKASLAAGVDVNLPDDSDDTPLINASDRGHLEIVRLLLKAGADANHQNKYNGFTALMLASKEGYIEIVRLLLKAGANVDSMAFIKASENNHIDIVRLMLAAGANVNEGDKYNSFTALMGASDRGHLEIVRLLLENGADANLKSYSGDTALVYAILSVSGKDHNIEIVRLLLAAGANVDDRALVLATEKGHTGLLRLLYWVHLR